MNQQPHEHRTHNCGQMLTQLNDYADGELSPELCADLETHLADCDDCRIVLDSLRKTIYLVRQLEDKPANLPGAVEQRLFAVLDLEEYLAG